MVSTHLKNISQTGSFPQIGMKINHHPDYYDHVIVILILKTWITSPVNRLFRLKAFWKLLFGAAAWRQTIQETHLSTRLQLLNVSSREGMEWWQHLCYANCYFKGIMQIVSPCSFWTPLRKPTPSLWFEIIRPRSCVFLFSLCCVKQPVIPPKPSFAIERFNHHFSEAKGSLQGR